MTGYKVYDVLAFRKQTKNQNDNHMMTEEQSKQNIHIYIIIQK